MKKRILSLILALVVACALVPQISMEASATGYDVINPAGVTGDDIVTQARKYLGVPYDTSGGNYTCRTGFGSTMMFDCSGFVYRVCRDLGLASTQPSEGTNSNGYYYITADTRYQKNYGTSLTSEVSSYLSSGSLAGFLPGDLIFFDYGSDNGTDHVGIYTGDGKVINATNSRGIYETPLSQTGWPEGTLGASVYAAVRLVEYCSHKDNNGISCYNNVGICSKCSKEYDWQSTYNTDCAGIYEVTLSGGVYLRKDKPYSASTNKSGLIKAGTQVQVLGSVTNCWGNAWYKVSYNGVTGYTSKDNLTWVGYGAQEISCTITSPKEGTTVPKAAYPVIGTVTSKYNLQEVVGYIDGSKFATVSLGNTTTLDIRSSAINHSLDFASLSPGSHTLVIKARDVHHSQLITVCTRKFVTEGATACSHSYSSKVTAAATCVKNGTRTYTCSKCGHSYTETIAATGVHSYGSWTTTQAATCTTTGTRKKTCSSCGDVQTLSIPATGHSYSSWVTTTAAGCTTAGTQKRTCSSCGDVQTQSIAATGHIYADGICTVCGTEEIVDSGTCGDNLTWRLLSRGKLVISGAGAMSDYCFSDNLPWNNYLSFINNVVIEDNVTSIGESAFEGCESLESITIPNSVTSIGKWAFEGCESLENITIPDSVTSIGECTFAYCQNLESITIPDGVTSIGAITFEGCESLESITIPDSVTSIGERAFAYCKNLGSITIPDSITSIGVRTFEGCESLESITIPDSVTSIGEWAFAGCKSLERIVIPASVTSIGPFAFSDCTSLTTAGPIGGDYDYQFGWTSEIPEFAFRNCMYLESITIPDSITSIGEMAFELCTSLESITIPNSVTSIGEWAFASCKSLESISIPDSVTSIGEYTFAYCENLESISIPDSVTSIGKMAFERCTSLQNVYYTGTKTQWEAVVIGSSNDALLNATVHFVENLLGDADGSGEVTTDDAVYLLLSVMFGAEDYPVTAGTNLDFDGNETVDTDDAVYLLLHVMFGAEDYPLHL